MHKLYKNIFAGMRLIMETKFCPAKCEVFKNYTKNKVIYLYALCPTVPLISDSVRFFTSTISIRVNILNVSKEKQEPV